MNISFNFLVKTSLPKRQLLKSFINDIFISEKKKAKSLNYIFCPDEYLLEINKTYLGHNYFTDIITFDLTEPGSKMIEGEIYISIDTIRENTKRFETTLSKELNRVIFHGVLHLCGYKDKTITDQSVMTEKENYYLDKYFQ